MKYSKRRSLIFWEWLKAWEVKQDYLIEFRTRFSMIEWRRVGRFLSRKSLRLKNRN